MSEREVTISIAEDSGSTYLVTLTVDGHEITFAWLRDDKWFLNLSQWELQDLLGFSFADANIQEDVWFSNTNRLGEVLGRILALDRDHLEKMY